MPIDVIGFAVARVEADKRGVGAQEATRIGVIGSVMPNPIMALVVARAMADREAPAAGAPAQALADVVLTSPGHGTTDKDLNAHIEQVRAVAREAKTSADHARQAAEEAGKAVGTLAHKVEAGFERIEQKLSKISPPSKSEGGGGKP